MAPNVSVISTQIWGFAAGSDDKESTCKSGDPCSTPGSGRIPWRRAQQPTLVFLVGQRGLVGYSLQGRQESETLLKRLNMQACTQI